MLPDGITLPFDDDRFWAKVDFNGPIPQHCPELGPCWVWAGSRDTRDYGTLTRRKMGLANTKTHRYAYLMTHGSIPDERVVCHHCDNPACVNPAHLFAGSMSDNTQDMIRKGRSRPPPRPPIETMRRGEQIWRARLTADQVREIRHRYGVDGVTLQMLADEYGITNQGIHEVVTRRTWKHVI